MTEQDYELLSAYIDGALEEDERTALETRLVNEPEMQRELNALRQTVALIQSLPELKAPRDFTLTPAMVGTATGGRTEPRLIRFVLPLLSIAAAVVVIVIGAYLLNTANQDVEPAADVAQVATATSTPASVATMTPAVPPVDQADDNAVDTLADTVLPTAAVTQTALIVPAGTPAEEAGLTAADAVEESVAAGGAVEGDTAIMSAPVESEAEAQTFGAAPAMPDAEAAIAEEAPAAQDAAADEADTDDSVARLAPPSTPPMQDQRQDFVNVIDFGLRILAVLADYLMQ